MPNEVIIDGVKYVPANIAVANSFAIKCGLMEFFWGTSTKDNIDEHWEGVRIQVSDDFRIKESSSIEEVLEEISKYIVSPDVQKQQTESKTDG